MSTGCLTLLLALGRVATERVRKLYQSEVFEPPNGIRQKCGFTQIIAKILLLHKTFHFYFHINLKSMKTILINKVNSLKTHGSSVHLSRYCKLAISIAHFKPKKTLKFQRSRRSNLSLFIKVNSRWHQFSKTAYL